MQSVYSDFLPTTYLSNTLKTHFIDSIKKNLLQFSEIEKIILFGSFVTSKTPNDIDIAIFQKSNDNYLTLSMKYRKALREISKLIPLDIVPVRSNSSGFFLKEIEEGKTIYEKRD